MATVAIFVHSFSMPITSCIRWNTMWTIFIGWAMFIFHVDSHQPFISNAPNEFTFIASTKSCYRILCANCFALQWWEVFVLQCEYKNRIIFFSLIKTKAFSFNFSKQSIEISKSVKIKMQLFKDLNHPEAWIERPLCIWECFMLNKITS